MKGRLDESRANIIREAIRNDAGSDDWLEYHYVTRDELEMFLDYAVTLSKMYEWRESNAELGSVEVSLTFTKHSGRVGSGEEQWTVFAPQTDTTKIIRVAETGRVIAQLTPEQMPISLDGVY